MATHSSILAWEISWTEEPGRLQSIGSQSRTQLKQLSMYARTHTHTHTHDIRHFLYPLIHEQTQVVLGCCI